MTINFPEWFLYALSATMVIHALASLVDSLSEIKMKRMKAHIFGVEAMMRMGELDPEEIRKQFKEYQKTRNT